MNNALSLSITTTLAGYLNATTAFGASLMDDANAAAGRTTMGATTVGGNIFTLTNPGAITWPRLNADNTVTALSASATRTALGSTTTGDGFFTLANPGAVAFPKIDASNVVTTESAATHRTSIGGTTIGQAFFTAANPGAITFPRANADNTLSLLSATDYKTALGITAASSTVGTAVATTSGTSVDITGIPAGTKVIHVNFVAVSTNGVDALLIQLGDAGGFETSGYTSTNSASSSAAQFTTGYGIYAADATNAVHGTLVLTLENSSSFTWAAAGVFRYSAAGVCSLAAGTKSLSAELTQIRLTTLNGTDAFDAGEFNITYIG